jgi:hypothetical protein
MVRLVFFTAVGLMSGFIAGANITKDELTEQHLLAIEERLVIERMNIEIEVELAERRAGEVANDLMLMRLFDTCTRTGKFMIQDATTGLDFFFTCSEVATNKS